MDNKEVILLRKALERQRRARQEAERILEEKSKELHAMNTHLKEENTRLRHAASDSGFKMDQVFLNIIDPYIVMDLDFNVVEMNDSANAFLGIEKDTPVNLASLVHPDFLEYTTQSFSSLMKVGLIKNYRSKLILPSGSLRWVQINASLVYDETRRPIAAQGIVRDITTEMEVKERLAAQKRQLDIIVEHSPLVLY